MNVNSLNITHTLPILILKKIGSFLEFYDRFSLFLSSRFQKQKKQHLFFRENISLSLSEPLCSDFQLTANIVKLSVTDHLPSTIPDSVSTLDITFKNEKFPIPPNYIPNSVTTLRIYKTNQKSSSSDITIISINSIPNSVTSLSISHQYISHNSLNLIPSSVKDLTLFNVLIRDNLDNNNSSNRELQILPPTVERLCIHEISSDGQSIDISTLTNSIKELELKKGVFLRSIKRFHYIPKTLKKLIIWEDEGVHLTKDMIPEGIEHLEFEILVFPVTNKKTNQKSMAPMTPTTAALLPSTLKSIQVGLVYIQDDDNDGQNDRTISFPNGLETLKINQVNNAQVIFPPKLMELEFGMDSIQKDNGLPMGLKKLVMRNTRKPLNIGPATEFPSAIHDLTLPKVSIMSKLECHCQRSQFNEEKKHFNQELYMKSVKVLFKQVKELTRLVFPFNFDIPLPPSFIPNSVVELNLGKDFNQKLNRGVLPSRLKELTIGESLDQNLKDIHIPATLELLTIEESRKLEIKVISDSSEMKEFERKETITDFPQCPNNTCAFSITVDLDTSQIINIVKLESSQSSLRFLLGISETSIISAQTNKLGNGFDIINYNPFNGTWVNINTLPQLYIQTQTTDFQNQIVYLSTSNGIDSGPPRIYTYNYQTNFFNYVKIKQSEVLIKVDSSYH
eukprot:gene704-872_t